MKIIDNIIDKFTEKRNMRVLDSQFKIFTGYSPAFTSYNEGLYEMGLTRASIHALANHTSKLNPVIKGSSYKNLEKIMQNKPNDIMTTKQFIYRLRTIYEVENNAYVIPIFADDTAMKIVGLYPVSTIGSEIVKHNGKLYLKYIFLNGYKVIEYEKVGHLRKHQYKSEFFGESNSALNTTMKLLDTQDQGIINGIKQGAYIRFLGKFTNILKQEDIKKERNRLLEESLAIDNSGGVLLYDNKISDLKPIDSKAWVIDDKQADHIKNNVYSYFGINEKIIQNNFDEDGWDAFYEGAIEPFAIELSQVITNMLFTTHELSYENMVLFESSRLQYASNKTKLEIVTQLFDRGFISHNQGLKIFNLPEIGKKGDILYIRKEYADVNNLDKEVNDGEHKEETNGEQNEENTNQEEKSNT